MFFFYFVFFILCIYFFLPVCTLVPTSTIPSRAKHSSENSCLRQMTRQWDSRHEHLTHQINKIVKRHKKALSFSPGPCSVSPCLLGSQRPSVFLRNEGRLVSAPLALTGHLRPPARSLKQQPSLPLWSLIVRQPGFQTTPPPCSHSVLSPAIYPSRRGHGARVNEAWVMEDWRRGVVGGGGALHRLAALQEASR